MDLTAANILIILALGVILFIFPAVAYMMVRQQIYAPYRRLIKSLADQRIHQSAVAYRFRKRHYIRFMIEAGRTRVPIFVSAMKRNRVSGLRIVSAFKPFSFRNLPDINLENEIRQYCPDVDNLGFAQRDTYEVTSNWKVMMDNFLECYHCHTAHRDFVDLVDMDSYRSEVHGIYSSHISNAANSTDNSAYKFEKGDVDFGYAGWYLWPNLTLWAYPGEANLSVLQMIPDGAGKTIEYQDWFVPNGQASAQLQEAMDYQKDTLQPEDIGLCESVQRGLKSNGYNQGRFVVDEDRSELSEHAVHHFQRLVAESLGADLGAR